MSIKVISDADFYKCLGIGALFSILTAILFGFSSHAFGLVRLLSFLYVFSQIVLSFLISMIYGNNLPGILGKSPPKIVVFSIRSLAFLIGHTASYFTMYFVYFCFKHGT